MKNDRVIVDLEKITNTCFIVMPFHSLFDAEYERVIKPATQDAGLECVRGNEIYTQQAIVQDIWKSIREARVVVAELSGRNPNVMYEIGLAHAIGKPVVLITRNEEDVPFDLRDIRFIFYDTNNPDWGATLRTDLTNMLRKILETPSLGKRLDGIEVQVKLPKLPEKPILQAVVQIPEHDLSGTWNTSWLSIKRQREHKAILMIPPDHGRNFVANMTVEYMREQQRTVIQETLLGTVGKARLILRGVNYIYLEQGSSQFYSLDGFDLELCDDGKSMKGEAILQHGKRDVIFYRLSGPITR